MQYRWMMTMGKKGLGRLFKAALLRHVGHGFLVVLLWTGVLGATCRAATLEDLLKQAVSSEDSSEYYFKKVDSRVKTDANRVLFDLYRAQQLTNLGKLDEAIRWNLRILPKVTALNDTEKRLTVYNNLGKLHQKQGANEAGLPYLFQGLKLAESVKNKRWMGIFCINIGLNYHDMEDFAKGVAYGKKAYLVLNQANDATAFQKILALNTIAINFDDWNKPDSALHYHYKVFDLVQEVDSINIPFTYNNIGNTLLKTGRYKMAESWILRASRIADLNRANTDALGYAYEKSTHFINLVTAAYKQKRIREAFRYLDSARLYTFESQSIEKRRDWYQVQYLMQETLGRSKEALGFLKHYYQVRDSIVEESKAKNVQELETRYEVEKKEKELALNKAKMLETANALRNKNSWMTGLSLLALLLGVILWLLVRQHRIERQRQARELALKEELHRIETQNQLQEQRLHLSRELHDNIGSQLTYILSSIKNLMYRHSGENNELLQQLSTVESFAGETLTELRDTVWATHADRLEFSDLVDRIHRVKDKNKQLGTDIHIELKADDSVRNFGFSAYASINLYRMVQEAVNNTLRHAKASEMTIHLKDAGSRIQLILEDNGCGFDTDAASVGNGLYNIRKRCQLLDGLLTLTSKVGEGTSLKLEFEKSRLGI